MHYYLVDIKFAVEQNKYDIELIELSFHTVLTFLDLSGS